MGATSSIDASRGAVGGPAIAVDAAGGTGALAAVGVTGLVVNSLALWLFVDPARIGLNYIVGAVLATQVSTTWNFVFMDRILYGGASKRRLIDRYLPFLIANNLILLARIPVLALLVSVLHTGYLVANLLTFVLTFLPPFAKIDRFLHRSERS
jgi:dolichol-phosphate mannosyltransferase